MRLELYDEDLLPEHTMCNASQTTFEKFNKAAQQAIIAAGQGTYFTNGRTNHNVIYPPKQKELAK